MGILREVAGQKFNKGSGQKPWSNRQIRARLLIPELGAVLSAERLCYARRIWETGEKSLWEAIDLESGLYKDSWKKGLLNDMEWILDGVESPWGKTPDEVFDCWTRKRRGWKNFVKRSLYRHTLREAIRWFHEGDGLQGGPSEDEVQEIWTCHCGVHFNTARARAVHAYKKHDEHSVEYAMVNGSICPCCMQQFWTPSRLRQHLQYEYKTRDNWCYKYLVAAAFERDESIEQPKEIPLPGLRRRESIPVHGPKNFGALIEHGKYIEDEVRKMEQQFEVLSLMHPSVLAVNEIQEGLQEIFTKPAEQWEKELEPWTEALDSHEFTVNFLFAGARFQWQMREDQQSWLALLHRRQHGHLFSYWFECNLKRMFFDRVKEQPVQGKKRHPIQKAKCKEKFAYPVKAPLPRGAGSNAAVVKLWEDKCPTKALVQAYSSYL